jgi:SAM-dependent methyltransferase
MSKQYDRAYFDRWYRGVDRVTTKAELRRKVTMALSVAEYFLRRPVRSVLDIGCGEGAWRAHLRALRPRIAYRGLDPSAYAVEAFGASRNIRRASFGELPSLEIETRFDLIVCSDVLHYVRDAEIRAGIREIVRVLDGVAFVEALTREDEVMGDLEGFMRRPSEWYRNALSSAGLVQVAPYCWLAPSLHVFAAELERP